MIDQVNEVETVAETVKRSAPKRKYDKLRRRAKANRRAELRLTRARALAKVQRRDLDALKSLVKEIESRPQPLDTIHEDVVRSLPDVPVVFQLGEDLTDSFRTLKPEGNLWKDWQVNAQRKGKMEQRQRIKAITRGRRLKMVEKYSFKHFA